ASAGWSIVGGNLVYAEDTLDAGEVSTVHVIAATDKEDCGTVDNTATVTTTNDGSDTDSASVEILCGNVDLTKTADADSVSAGDEIGFTVTLQNTGAGQAKGVSFTDALPAGLTWTISPASAGWSIVGGNLVYAEDTLDAGETTTVHMIATTDKDACGTVDNTASVTTTNDGSDTDSASVEVLCGDVELEKVADAGSVNAGDEIGFTLTVANVGDGEARDVTVTDALPDAAGLVWSIDEQSSDSGCSIAAGELTCEFGTLAAGASKSVHVTSSTTAASCGTIDNTGTVATSNDGSDSDSASVAVQCPDIAVSKAPDAATYGLGETIGFTITASNAGPGSAVGVTVLDSLPAQSGLSWSVDGGTGAGECVIAAGKLTCEFGTLASGASRSVHISSPTTAASCATIDNTATVSASNDDSESGSAVTRCVAIDIEKTGPASATVGDVLSYVLTITNPGVVSFPAQNVVVTDPRCSQPPVLQGKGTDATPDSFDPGDAWTYTCSAETTGQQPGTFVNTATVTGTDGSGRKVTDSDEFPTQLVAQQTLPEQIVNGTARLTGPSGCVKKAFNATVRGRRIAKVTFFVDGKKRATITAEPGQRKFQFKVRPNALGRGIHRVTAKVEFVAESQTKSRTLRLSFQRCRRETVQPRFTG
ncbi:MAG TPA: DUF11 domain-containing protein, partial [Acidimicrobiia bacterium]|nr:DUF11 domain-containing protein [Acidimicrobiia bacterium]